MQPARVLNYPGQIARGVSGVQTLAITGTPTGGTFKLAYNGRKTAAIAYNATAAAVQAALEALPGIKAGGVVCTGGALPGASVVITFSGHLARRAVSVLQIADVAFTGGTAPAATITLTTTGVDAGLINECFPGDLVIDANGLIWRNAAISGNQAPDWTTIGPPRLTTTQRDALSPVAGLVIYNTTTSKVEAYSGSAWAAVGA